MPYMHMLSDSGMNYTLNRPLLDGTSAARIKEIGAVATEALSAQRKSEQRLIQFARD